MFGFNSLPSKLQIDFRSTHNWVNFMRIAEFLETPHQSSSIFNECIKNTLIQTACKKIIGIVLI